MKKYLFITMLCGCSTLYANNFCSQYRYEIEQSKQQVLQQTSGELEITQIKCNDDNLEYYLRFNTPMNEQQRTQIAQTLGKIEIKMCDKSDEQVFTRNGIKYVSLIYNDNNGKQVAFKQSVMRPCSSFSGSLKNI